MPTNMVHGDFKPGERCKAAGQYGCATCKSFGRVSTIQLEAGKAFPECGSCKERGALEVDTVWKVNAPGR